MTKIDPKVASAARSGARPGVLILVDRDVPEGPAPLALDRSLKTTADRANELHDRIRELILLPACRQEPGALRPMGAPRAEQAGGVVLANLGAVMGAVDERRLRQLQDMKHVRKIVPIPRMLPMVSPLEYRVAAPADLTPGPVWGLRKIGAQAFWDAGLLGQGMRIGHFDTGVNASHPSFAQLLARNGLRYTAYGADGQPTPGAQPADRVIKDIVFHGTHTAGTLVGAAIGSTDIGIAPLADLISVQIFPDPAPPTSDEHDELVVNALNFIVGERPHVINMSFGSGGWNASYFDVVTDLINQNIVVVAAVGNTAGTTSSPGNYARVICVGAVDENDAICDFSGSGAVRGAKRPDLCAPGKRIISAGRADDAALFDGTSMSAPHVAAVVALIRQKNDELTPFQIKNRLKRSCRLPGGWDGARGGAGILDAAKVLSGL